VASYDGRYSGSHHSNDLIGCGIQTPSSTTSALIAQGRIVLNHFGPNTKMEGTVGDDGWVRASGLWLAPHSFPAMTLLHGQITGTTLMGTASNARCVTKISLDRLAPARPGHVLSPSAARTSARTTWCCDQIGLMSRSIRNRLGSCAGPAVRPDPGQPPGLHAVGDPCTVPGAS